MDQNQEPPMTTDTPPTTTPPPIPTTPIQPEAPIAPNSVPPVVPTTDPTPVPLAPPPATPIQPEAPTTSISPTEAPAVSSNNNQTSSSLPPGSHKKTIAVAAAGVSVLLVVLGVYAMTKDSFNTQTKQEASAPRRVPTVAAPSITPTPSDVVDQNLNGVEAALKSADTEAAGADQELSATPADLQ